jgi:hypothetical protein
MNSLGWKLKLPIAIQRAAPRMLCDTTKTSPSETKPPKYAIIASRSKLR